MKHECRAVLARRRLFTITVNCHSSHSEPRELMAPVALAAQIARVATNVYRLNCSPVHFRTDDKLVK